MSSRSNQHVAARCAVAGSLAAFALLGSPACGAELDVQVRDLAGNALPNAVVFVEPVGGAAHPATQSAHTSVDQVNKEFVPLVTIVQTGTEVAFPNSDNIRHSIYSFSAPKVFTLKLYSGKQAPPVVFDKPGLVVLGCNIHDTMVAWVVVVDTPYFAKTGADGAGVLKGLEPGDYRLNVWYPAPAFTPQVQTVHVSAAIERQEVRLDTTGSPLPGVLARAQHGN